VPPQGTVSFTSAATSTNIIAGWAIVISSLPFEGVAQYRFSVNGTPQQGVSVQATPASILFRPPATAASGLALANPFAVPISLNVVTNDSGGKAIDQTSLTLPAMGHKSSI
jgi:hypothetical protein